ncbi:MAG: hypothetical protein GY880_04265 [Planctomycetaceae bacterium]|nr:hypothetical protein [Planctomycetaceae bacterium]
MAITAVFPPNHMFDDFVLDAVADGNTDFDYDSNLSAQRLLIQFNHEIDAIVKRHGTERTGIAVWYCYGCVSGMIYDVLDDSVSSGWSAFYESMFSLYHNGFAKHCENLFNHPLRKTKFGTSCYMIWDMDGIEYLTFDRLESKRKMVEPLIDFGLGHGHAVVQESILHCLGHQLDSHTEFVQPKLQQFLRRRDLQPEIREYAIQCQTGIIL